jgi:hypothetical protein
MIWPQENIERPPKGTMARLATAAELKRDGIKV